MALSVLSSKCALPMAVPSSPQLLQPPIPTAWRGTNANVRRRANNDAPRSRESVQCHSSGQASFKQGAGSVSFFSAQGDGTTQQKPEEGNKLAQMTSKLRSMGLAGVVSYGLLNTLYYTISFVLFWTFVAKVPQGLGAAAAIQSFGTVFAAVWAGSQVTKLARAGGALFLAPFVDKAMETLCRWLKLRSKQQAFGIIVGGCIAVALAVFSVVIAAWA